ncbi:hypothetical protein BaRGS_00037590 [Batillaria attramentaria]|uniref:Secreted protein n=1 Tax=Batillaria attramentaria TaxID=370345 RepID=A0ABD0J8K7_9CAEN
MLGSDQVTMAAFLFFFTLRGPQQGLREVVLVCDRSLFQDQVTIGSTIFLGPKTGYGRVQSGWVRPTGQSFCSRTQGGIATNSGFVKGRLAHDKVVNTNSRISCVVRFGCRGKKHDIFQGKYNVFHESSASVGEARNMTFFKENMS